MVANIGLTAAGIAAGTNILQDLMASPLASGVSSILGSAFGRSENKGQDAANQFQWNREFWKEQLKDGPRYMAQGAKRAGLHPLAALGISPTAGSIVGGGSGGSIEGQNLGRAISSGVQGYRDKELFELAVERAGLENELLKTQITNVNRQPGDAPNPQPGTSHLPVDVNTPYGKQATAPRYIWVRDPRTGKTIPVTNPEAGDNEFLMAWDFATATLPAEFKNKFGDDLKKIKDAHRKDKKSWNPVWNKLQENKRRNEANKLSFEEWYKAGMPPGRR